MALGTANFVSEQGVHIHYEQLLFVESADHAHLGTP